MISQASAQENFVNKMFMVRNSFYFKPEGHIVGEKNPDPLGDPVVDRVKLAGGESRPGFLAPMRGIFGMWSVNGGRDGGLTWPTNPTGKAPPCEILPIFVSERDDDPVTKKISEKMMRELNDLDPKVGRGDALSRTNGTVPNHVHSPAVTRDSSSEGGKGTVLDH